MSGQTLSNGAAATYTYDAKAQMTELTNRDGGGNLLSDFNSMSYDSVGNRTSLTANVPSYSNYSGTTNYSYDGKNELTEESSTRNGGFTNNFAYDTAENPTTFRNASGKTYNTDNQPTTSGFSYDGDGNPTTYSGASLTFDVENRLTSVSTELTAGYGADGLRAWKTDNTGTSYYLYDEDGTTPVCELNASGVAIATNTFGEAGLISRHTSTGSTFYAFDPQGTVAERLNSAGSATGSSTADAFGIVSNSAAATDPFGYVAQAGYYTDQSTGLILTTYRYYDPGQGRFLNRDPIGYDGGVDLYDYVQNGAENRSDPSGLFLFAPVEPVDPENPVELPVTLDDPPIFDAPPIEVPPVLEEGGGAVILGGGPEDPAGDVIGAIIVIGGVIYGLMHGPQSQTCGKKKSRQSGAEGATDVPSWAKPKRPKPGESCHDFALRILKEHYGEQTDFNKGSDHEYSKIVKWCERTLRKKGW